MKRGGTHFWRPPIALGLRPPRAQLKRHPPTHQLTNTKGKKGGNSDAFGTRNIALPLTNPLLVPLERGTHHFEKGSPPAQGRGGEALGKGLVAPSM